MGAVSAGSVSSVLVAELANSTVLWTSDIAADSFVSYGLGVYPSTAVGAGRSSELVTSHSIALNGLTPSTLYWALIFSEDSYGDPLGYSGNLAPSGILQFTTPTPPPPKPASFLSFTAMATGSKTVRLLWDPSAVPSGSFQVYRGTTNVLSAASPVGSPLAPGTALYNDYGPLTPGTLYYYWLVQVS